MVAILYWPLLLASLFFGMIGIIVSYDFISKGNIVPAIMTLTLLVPAIFLLAKKKSIFEWGTNKIGRAKEILKEEIEKAEKEHAEKEARKESERLENKIKSAALERSAIADISTEDNVFSEDEEEYAQAEKREKESSPISEVNSTKIKPRAGIIVKIESSSIRYFNLLFRFSFWFVFLLLSIIKAALIDTSKSRKKKQEKPRRPPAIQLLTPWILELDSQNKMIRFKKRNWFLIGSDTHSFKYVNVRNILINEKIITADIHIKVFSGTISAYYFTKEDAQNFKDCLLRDSDFDEELIEVTES